MTPTKLEGEVELGGEVVETSRVDEALARKIDGEVRHEWKSSQRSLTRLAGLLNELRDGLWTLLADPDTKQGFKRFDEYVANVTGDKISHHRLYDLLSVWGLTQGPSALSRFDVEEMGRGRAVEVARLAPKDRTPEIVEAAKREPLRKVKARVQEKLNEAAVPEEHREATALLSRNLSIQTIEMIEEIEIDAVYMPGVRDADSSVSLRNKLWHAVWTFFREHYAADIAEGRKYRLAMEAAESGGAKKNGNMPEEGDDGGSYGPPGPEDVEAELHATAACD
jgi:hypothetical protein